MLGTVAVWALPILLTGGTLLPLVRSDYWTFRVLEYPRFQKLVLGIFCLILLFVLREHAGSAFLWLFIASFACCIFLLIKIIPYTPLARKEMLQAKSGDADNSLKVFTANVLQSNQEFDRMLAQIQQKDPDVIFLVETDDTWAEGMKRLEQSHPFVVQQALDNTYGILFYSRLPVRNEQVLYRTDPEVPSVEAEVQLRSGHWIKVFGLHPKPPVPHESLYSTAKDKELMKVAFKVKEESEPCIVMGDLNDVAWSHVTQLFRKVSGLLDPRRGRGFYSTYSARNWLMRIPLDYIFCSAHFALIKMNRMPYNGSDHFAMFIHLQYDPRYTAKQETPKADQEEKQEAAEKASEPVKDA